MNLIISKGKKGTITGSLKIDNTPLSLRIDFTRRFCGSCSIDPIFISRTRRCGGVADSFPDGLLLDYRVNPASAIDELPCLIRYFAVSGLMDFE
jgi:hypothetical protein